MSSPISSPWCTYSALPKCPVTSSLCLFTDAPLSPLEGGWTEEEEARSEGPHHGHHLQSFMVSGK